MYLGNTIAALTEMSFTAYSFLPPRYRRRKMKLMKALWMDDSGQDIAEYAVMLAVILVIVVGTIRLIGTQANNVFSQTASAIGG